MNQRCGVILILPMGTEVVIFCPRWNLPTWHEHWQPLPAHLQRPTTLKLPRLHRSPCSRPQVLSLFLLSKNVVPVVLVGFGYWLLTLAHTLFFWCSVRFVFSLGRGFRLGFNNLLLGDRFFRRSVFGLIN